MTFISAVRMFSRSVVLFATLLVLTTCLLDSHVEARYLPTRANGDRVDKLREMLKEVSKIYTVSHVILPTFYFQNHFKIL